MSIGFYVCGVSFEVSSNENGPLQIKECSEYNKQAHTQEARATIRVVCVLQLIIWEKGVSHCRNFLDQSQSEAILKETENSGGIYC